MMPGMAAGPNIFEFLKLPDTYEIHYLHWLQPLSVNESLQQYCKRLIEEQIYHENPILLGVSFGGIIIQEMAQQIDVRQLILISTIKNEKEWSPFHKAIRQTHLYKLLPLQLFNHITFLEKFAVSKRIKHRIELYKRYMDVKNPEYLKWSIKKILNWKATPINLPFVHFVGDKDLVFPPRYIHNPKIIVPKGRHDMIIFKANWFNKYLPEILVK